MLERMGLTDFDGFDQEKSFLCIISVIIAIIKIYILMKKRMMKFGNFFLHKIRNWIM